MSFVTDAELGAVRVFTAPGAASVIAYGFSDSGPVALMNNALGLEVETDKFVQLDVRDLLKYYNNGNCENPTITITDCNSLEIGGSYETGVFGEIIFPDSEHTVRADSGFQELSLFNPAGVSDPALYPYISVRALVPATIAGLSFEVCEFGSEPL